MRSAVVAGSHQAFQLTAGERAAAWGDREGCEHGDARERRGEDLIGVDRERAAARDEPARDRRPHAGRRLLVVLLGDNPLGGEDLAEQLARLVDWSVRWVRRPRIRKSAGSWTTLPLWNGCEHVDRDAHDWPCGDTRADTNAGLRTAAGRDPVVATCETGRLAGVHGAVRDRSAALLSRGRTSRR